MRSLSELKEYRSKLKSFLLQSIKVSQPEEVEVVINDFGGYFFKKKDLIVRPGEVSKHLFFVVEGVQRSYFLRDKEYTIAFAYEESFCAVPDSFILNRPSKHYLESITDSIMLGIERDRFYEAMNEYPWLLKTMLSLQGMMLSGLHDRMTEVMALSMEERFESFTNRSFHLFNRGPHIDIA